MSKSFIVKLKRSTISCSEDQIRTVRAIGLRKINHTVIVADNLANRGQLNKVQHLLEITIKK
ncbi:MAG: 50S ribosomal protein L30 [Pseudobdellovibrio sp.]